MTMRIEIKPYGRSAEIWFGLYDDAQPGRLLSGVTFVAGDTKISKDGVGFVNCSNDPVEIGSTGVYSLTLTASEMECTKAAIINVIDQGTPIWMDHTHVVEVTAWRTLSDNMSIWQVNADETPSVTSCDATRILGPWPAGADVAKNLQMAWFGGAGEDEIQACFCETYTVGAEDKASFTFTSLPNGIAPDTGDKFILVG